MKKLFLLFPLTALLILPAFRTDKSIILRLNLKEGETYLYHSFYKQNITSEAAGNSTDIKTNMESDMNMKVAAKYETDSTLLEVTYGKIMVHIVAPKKEITIDSRDTAGAVNKQIRKYLDAIQKNPILLKTNSLGQILEIRGLDILRSETENGNSAMQKVTDKLFSEKNIRNNFSNLDIYPEKPVSVGDHWEKTTSLENIVSLDNHTTFTVKEIQPKNVILDVYSRITSFKDSATINGMTLPAHVTGTQSGTYTVERSTGLVSNAALDQKIDITLTMMGQSLKVRVDGAYNLSESLVK